MSLPAVLPEREPLTLREAQLIGVTANRYQRVLELLLDCSRGGTLAVATKGGTATLSLPRQELEAVLSLILERDQALLSAFNVETGR